MAIVQISRIQHRRGLQQDLPQLASAELAWSIDTRQLWIGNGLLEEGAPTTGVTEILTQYSILDFTNTLTANVAALQSNVTILQEQVAALGGTSTSVALSGASSGTLFTTTANNIIFSYTLNQGTKQRNGQIKVSRLVSGTTASYDEEYTETATTDLVFSVDASSGTQANINYTTTTASSLLYSVSSLI